MRYLDIYIYIGRYIYSLLILLKTLQFYGLRPHPTFSKNLKKLLFFYANRPTFPKPEFLHEKLKTVLPAEILIFFPYPHLHQILKPIRKFFCTF